ncbi:MAG: 50S ribosomal protein L35 [Proteobacteria bacterium]|nr:50S ribosomal protein L35 [Pseudomonadota bacterium]
MPKIKNRRGAAKRFKRSAKGKILHKKANARHILESKGRKRKRKLRKKNVLKKVDRKAIKRLLPNW